ncbi:AATF leucine zipper-containing domain [Dillenia turbinata]|uniref:AATF leucine zipper-containing domain n=1 Tax=Dillenia turbinata TaxID=194707 RepID=A0AAN8UTJ7_9MAGN
MGKRSRRVQREDSDFEEDDEYEEPIVSLNLRLLFLITFSPSCLAFTMLVMQMALTVEEEEDMEEDESEDDEQNEKKEDESEGDEQNEERNNNELEELEKEYKELRQKEQPKELVSKYWDLLKNLTRHKEEDLLKGQAVKNQRVLWDKSLAFRFLLQKPFSSSNRLPQGPLRSSFCDLDKDVSVAYSDLVTSCQKTLDTLLELQKALVEKNPAISQATEGNSRPSAKNPQASKGLDEEADEEWSQISQMQLSFSSFAKHHEIDCLIFVHCIDDILSLHVLVFFGSPQHVVLVFCRIAPFRDKSVDKWQRKTLVTTGAAALKGKSHAFNQKTQVIMVCLLPNISEQVTGYMRDPSRMIKRMQLRRSMVAIFSNVSKSFLPINFLRQYIVDANADGDPELLDDSEFYQQLLKEFLETFDPTSSEMALYAMKKLRTKKRKIVDCRASKSRKIRYNVHEKIVNFMAPQPMRLPSMAPALFDNLFGFRNQKPACAI